LRAQRSNPCFMQNQQHMDCRVASLLAMTDLKSVSLNGLLVGLLSALSENLISIRHSWQKARSYISRTCFSFRSNSLLAHKAIAFSQGEVNQQAINFSGGATRNRTEVHGFAGRCITTLPSRQIVRPAYAGAEIVEAGAILSNHLSTVQPIYASRRASAQQFGVS
jgi:hypothetical protein